MARNSFGAITCGHMVCYSCALKCSDTDEEQFIIITCPICRSKGKYKELS